MVQHDVQRTLLKSDATIGIVAPMSESEQPQAPQSGDSAAPSLRRRGRPKSPHPPSPPKRRLTIRIPVELDDALSALAKTRRHYLNEEIVEALWAWVRSHQQSEPPEKPNAQP